MRITATPGWMVCVGGVGFLFGVACASWFSGLAIGGAAMLSVLVFAWALRALPRKDLVTLSALAAFGCMIGIGRYALAGPSEQSIANDVGRRASLEGRVIARELTDTGVTYVLDSLVVDGSMRSDRARLEAPISSDANLGEYVHTVCSLDQPQAFSGFAYDRFLAAKSIYAICKSSGAPLIFSYGDVTLSDRFWLTIGTIHSWIEDRARAILPEPQATLLLGLLIGENDFSDAWQQKFQITGTSHIVAASGYNVALVSEFALLALVSLGLYRRQAYPLVLGAISVFAILAGAGGAVVRASVMGVLVITASHLGRKASLRNVIVLTVVAMLMFEPRILRDDVGFQLSIASTLGLVMFSSRFSSLLSFVPPAFGIRESLASTLAATLSTLPISLLSFGKISVIAPVVNILVLPFIPYAMAFGGGAIVLSSIVRTIGVWIALPAWTALVTMTGVIGTMSKIPFASFAAHSVETIVMFGIAFAIVVAISVRLPKTFERTSSAMTFLQALRIMTFAVVLFGINIAIITWQSGRLNTALVHVFVFDVGQGDAMFIHGESRDIVIDGGPTRYGLVEALARVRYPWERTIDDVIATHPHADHVLGLLALPSSANLFVSGAQTLSPAVEALQTHWQNATIFHAPSTFDLGQGATLTALWPKDEISNVTSTNVHDRSIVVRLDVGQKSMLFTGDAESEVEAQLPGLQHVDVLKVGHHGSDTSTSQEFLQQITPSIAVISAGEGNSYGHPSPFTLGRLQSVGAEIVRTDKDGTIRFDFWKDVIAVHHD